MTSEMELDALSQSASTSPPTQMQATNPQENSLLIRYMKTRFPLELLHKILDYFTADDFRNFRHTCSEVERGLLLPFQRRFFSKREVLMTVKGLEDLLEISKSDKFRGHVKSIIIKSADSDEPLHADHEDVDLRDTGDDKALLTEALAGLLNVESIQLFSKFMPRPRIAPGSEHERRLFRLVLRSAAEAEQLSLSNGEKKKKLQKFELIRTGGPGGGVGLLNFNLAPRTLMVVKPLLANLRSITLAIDPSCAWTSRLVVPGMSPPNLVATKYVTEFLSHTRLEVLRLNIDRSQSNYCEAIMGTFILKSHTPALDNVTDLQLGKMTITPQTLFRVVDRFSQQLNRLSFFRIGLAPQSNTPGTNDKALWQKALMKIGGLKTLTKLVYFQASHLTQNRTVDHVSFKEPGQDGKTDLTVSPTRELRGFDVPRLIVGLADDVIMPKSPDSEDDDADDSEDQLLDDDDDEDDDDDDEEDEDDN